MVWDKGLPGQLDVVVFCPGRQDTKKCIYYKWQKIGGFREPSRNLESCVSEGEIQHVTGRLCHRNKIRTYENVLVVLTVIRA